MRSAYFLKAAALGAVVAVAVSTTAVAQQGNAYGLGQPAAVSNLPAGPFRSALEALPGPARGRAMAILRGGEFTDGDLPYLRVDRRGGVFFEDPEWATGEGGEAPPPAEITETDAFTLHSKPGAPKTIYIDFDGHNVTGTVWNNSSGYTSHPMKPYDTDGDPLFWTAGELDVVADVWRRMVEDFAPYDVDVTTEEPAVFDGNVGHILVTRKVDENGHAIYNCNCGGVAYYGGFGYPYKSPGLVFQDGLSGTHNIAEAASHELGHNLYLAHDGTSSSGYYTGHGPAPVNWAPIMGVGYYRNVTQWSKGEYSGANNTEDDLQKITTYIPYRTDDHEDVTLPSATPLLVTGGVNVVALGRVSDSAMADLANKGIVEDRNDIDLFSLDVGAGLIDLTITPGYFEEFTTGSRRGMNLDIEALLLDDLGNVLQTSNPDLETDAQITYSVTVAGRYYLEIRGVGRGDPMGDGYTDYASLGQYYISGTVPEDVVSTAPPVAPDDLIAILVDDVSIDLDWTDPISPPEANESGYRVMRSVDGGAFALRANLPRDSVSYSDNNLANGDYAYRLELYNGAGTSQTVTTAPIDVAAPLVAVATSEISAAGSVLSGSYLNTQASAGSEQLSEQHSGGSPKKRVSSLEHSWSMPGVVSAATVTLYLHAYAPSNGGDDDFDFTYTVNNSGDPQPIGTLLGGATQEWTIVLPNDTNGTVVVQVVDTDRIAGNGGTDTVTVYEMHVTSAGPATDQPPVVAISEPLGGTTVPMETELVFSATVTDEDFNLAAGLSWSSDIDGPLGSSASFAATLSQGAHVVTASVMDSALQPGNDSVSVLVLPPDDTPPTIAAPADVGAEATGPATVVALGTPVVTDDIDPSPNVSSEAPAAFPVGITVVTWTATDASGNAANDTQNVTVSDTTAPVVTVLGDNPANVVVGEVYVDAGATAADLVDGDVSGGIGASGEVIDTATTGTHVVTYTVSDVAGNSGQATRTVTVVEASAVLTVTEISPSTINLADLPAGVAVTITGTGLTDVQTVTFQNGSGPSPSAASVTPTGAQTLTAVVSGKIGGPPKKRYWDVVVTRANGDSAVCAGCLTITP